MIIGEICTLEVMILSVFFIRNKDNHVAVKLETAIVVSVILTILIQAGVSIFMILKDLKQKWRKWKGKREKKTQVEIEKVTPDHTHVFRIEHFDGFEKEGKIDGTKIESKDEV